MLSYHDVNECSEMLDDYKLMDQMNSRQQIREILGLIKEHQLRIK